MKLSIVFPQTSWLESEIGFSSIEKIREEFLKLKQNKEINFQYHREYQSIIFELLIENQDTIQVAYKITQNLLPESYRVPALLESDCLIISKAEINVCDPEEEIFRKLLQDAHLQLIDKTFQATHKLGLSEVNKLCNDFAEGEGFVVPLKEFDLVKFKNLIFLDEEFEYKLTGVLIDIKTNFFALDYELKSPYSSYNYNFVKKQIEKGPIEGRKHWIVGLDFDHLFWMDDDVRESYFKFKRYIHYSNAIVRIRTLWEKLIGLAILLESPSDFDKVQGARRVKSEFIKRFKEAKNPITQMIWNYIHSMILFDEQYRTPELHKTGRAIHWASMEGVEIDRLLAYRNDLNRVLRSIVNLLDQNDQRF